MRWLCSKGGVRVEEVEVESREPDSFGPAYFCYRPCPQNQSVCRLEPAPSETHFQDRILNYYYRFKASFICTTPHNNSKAETKSKEAMFVT